MNLKNPETKGPSTSTRQSLIDAAIEVFRERGYEGTHLQDVARRCGLTTGAVYSGFGSKEELLTEATWEASGKAIDEPLYDDVGAPESPAARIRMVLGGIFRAANRDIHVESIIATRRSERFAAVFSKRSRMRTERFKKLIREAVDAGEIDQRLDPDALAHVILSILSGVALLDVASMERPDEAAWQAVIDQMVDSWRPQQRSDGKDG